ncbi:hypothetical protein L209DRAFT_106164 [Thermothelomyces heterothallicus CBS 203.75]
MGKEGGSTFRRRVFGLAFGCRSAWAVACAHKWRPSNRARVGQAYTVVNLVAGRVPPDNHHACLRVLALLTSRAESWLMQEKRSPHAR